MKYINFKRYKFSTVVKNFNVSIYKFSKIFRFLDFRRYNFREIYKYADILRFDFKKIAKYINPKKYNIHHIKKISFSSSKFLLLHIPASIIFFGFLYIYIPTFYNYESSNIEKEICKKQNVECFIRGKVNYSFYPSPRIKINDLIINDTFKKKSTLIKADLAVIKLSIKNLLSKEKHKFQKIELKKFEARFDLKKLNKYKNIFTENNSFIPVSFKKGKIMFFDESDYVLAIDDVDSSLTLKSTLKEGELKGKFLNDDIYISFNNKKINNNPTISVLLKMADLNLLTKANFFNSKKDANTINGNILIKKGKHKFTGIIDYKDNEIKINKSNLRNIFLDGKLEGKIKILPYFDFNLDLSLNSLNFTKLYNYFLALDEKKQKNLFKINNKINGKLSLSSDRIYSSYNLVKSFESRIKFNNGNILVEQFLFNLGKLGAADMVGTIHNDKKFTNFKYESNIFVDNQKKFLSKFGIYNKKDIPSNLFVSGHFDFENVRSSFYEISDNTKLSNEDVNFIEREFNDQMLSGGYKSLFRFPKFKEFVKSITSEIN